MQFEPQNGYTALILAAMNGGADCVRLLLERGADKNAACRVRLAALLCFWSEEDYARSRLSFGIDIDMRFVLFHIMK
jgi:ankyrin repeat protein